LRAQLRRRARFDHGHFSRFERLAVDGHGAFHEIDRHLVMFEIELGRGARPQFAVQVDDGREHLDGRPVPPRRAEDQPEIAAVALEARQGLGLVVMEGRLDVFLVRGQGDPGLDAVEAVPGSPFLVRCAFGMHHAAAGRHPVHVAGADGQVDAETVLVLHGAVEQIGHGCQGDVGVRAHIDALARREVGRAHLVEKDEGPHHAAARIGQDTADFKPAQVARAALNGSFDLAVHRFAPICW
jgi:hypothetical protein